MSDIIVCIILSVMAICSFVLSVLQFKGKGIVLNNAYLYASEEERKSMNKKPYYKQSGITFLLVGVIFLINAINMILQCGWVVYPVIIIVFITVVYAIGSSILIEIKQKKDS